MSFRSIHPEDQRFVSAVWRPWVEDTDKGPDYRLVSCKLVDLTLPAPVYAGLVTSEDGQRHSLIWSR